MAAKTGTGYKVLDALVSANERQLEEIAEWLRTIEDGRLALIDSARDWIASTEGTFSDALRSDASQRLLQRAANYAHFLGQQPHRDCLGADTLYWLNPALQRLKEAAELLLGADGDTANNLAIDTFVHACDGWKSEGNKFGQLIGMAMAAYRRASRKAKHDDSEANTADADSEPARSDNAKTLLALLCRHHQYDHEGIGNIMPIGVREAERKLENTLNAGSLSRAFRELFPTKYGKVGHARYRCICHHSESAIFTALRGLCDEFASRFSIDSDSRR